MSTITRHDRITVEPDKMGGQPCIRGLRFPVASLLRYIAAGRSREELLADFPYLEAEDIPAALEYAADRLAGDER